MPYGPNDKRYQHLQITRTEKLFDRRKKRGFGAQPPDRGSRNAFGKALRASVAKVIAAASRPETIDHRLVFRIPLAKGASVAQVIERLGDAELTVVSVDPDGAIVAFREQDDLAAFHRALAEYERGPAAGKKSTKWDVLQFVEAAQMRALEPQDRLGVRLQGKVELVERIDDAEIFVVEVELWARGGEAARKDIAELEKLATTNASAELKVLDRYEGTSLVLAKVRANGIALKAMLEIATVAEVDLPPLPLLSVAHVNQQTKDDFDLGPPPAEDAPSVCVIDSGITAGHPLLRQHVGHEESILTAKGSAADTHGHGTRVAGVAVYGDVRAAHGTGKFQSPIRIFSARVLNEYNAFDDEKLVYSQMREAIRMFVAQPYDCRVFNISLGTSQTFNDGKQPQWAEQLDLLAREMGVLIVVSAGNIQTATNNPADAEALATSYPGFLLELDARIVDPATAALAVTVGSINLYDEPAVRHGADKNDLIRQVGKRNQLSAFTRLGPGVRGAVKPEFVDGGGGLAWSGTSSMRRISNDNGLAVMSLSKDPTERLFHFDVGTSYAAPKVARAAALVWKRVEDAIKREVDPNLVRALLAVSAKLPEGAADCFDKLTDSDRKAAMLRAYGYGQVDEDLLLASSDRRVVLFSQDRLAMDHFAIYEIPLPQEFKRAKGNKRVTVALAYDPPVRRRRLDYLGVAMDVMLIRGKSIDEIEKAYAKLDKDEAADSAFNGKFKAKLEPTPGAGPVKGTLQQGVWTFSREKDDMGETLHLVVRASRKWSEDEEQSYAVAIALEGDDGNLYQRLQTRLRQQAIQRARARGRV